jgi:hypothetical protein
MQVVDTTQTFLINTTSSSPQIKEDGTFDTPEYSTYRYRHLSLLLKEYSLISCAPSCAGSKIHVKIIAMTFLVTIHLAP